MLGEMPCHQCKGFFHLHLRSGLIYFAAFKKPSRQKLHSTPLVYAPPSSQHKRTPHTSRFSFVFSGQIATVVDLIVSTRSCRIKICDIRSPAPLRCPDRFRCLNAIDFCIFFKNFFYRFAKLSLWSSYLLSGDFQGICTSRYIPNLCVKSKLDIYLVQFT